MTAPRAAGAGDQQEDGERGRGAARAETQEVHELIRTVQYEQALERARELHENEPDDEELADLHRRAYVAWLLNQGRVASFDDRDMEALAIFEQAQQLAPGSELVQSWIGKTKGKIADHWMTVAQEALASEELEEAAEAYGKALEFAPGHPVALRGLGETTLVMNHRLGLGEDYYSEGISALSEYWLQQARWNFAATQKYTPENERADSRRTHSEEQLAELRAVRARSIEEAGLFAAAFNEYRLALALDPENQTAAEGMARVEPEKDAAKMIRDADMLIKRQRYDEALELLARAEPMTSRQTEKITAARQQVSDERLETLYTRALNLEHDQQFPAAILAYEKLFEFVDYYKDARTRQSTLSDYVDLAAKYYERAEQAESAQEKLELLLAIRAFWSEYRDIVEQIDALEDELEPDQE